jgi:hypothetical protein
MAWLFSCMDNWTLGDNVVKIQENVWEVLWSHRPTMCWRPDIVAVALEMESSLTTQEV